jgi:hypothetical protein
MSEIARSGLSRGERYAPNEFIHAGFWARSLDSVRRTGLQGYLERKAAGTRRVERSRAVYANAGYLSQGAGDDAKIDDFLNRVDEMEYLNYNIFLYHDIARLRIRGQSLKYRLYRRNSEKLRMTSGPWRKARAIESRRGWDRRGKFPRNAVREFSLARWENFLV